MLDINTTSNKIFTQNNKNVKVILSIVSLKILHAGNLVNHGYHLVKKLREEGVMIDLLLRKNPKQTEDPKFFDEELNEYPKWIKFFEMRGNWKWNVIKIMKEYDVVQASTEFPIFSLFAGKPYVAFATGSDIIELAHKNTIKGILLKWAYRRAKVVIFPGPYMFDFVKKLKLKNAIFIPFPWDYSKFFPIKNFVKDNQRFTIFHPTNHFWRQKRNDIFLKAFIKFASEHKNVELILIKRGPDFEKSLKVLEKKVSKHQITIIPCTIPQSDLNNFYNKADVVVDQFFVGTTGLIGQEAMASGKSLIQYADKELYEKFYSEPPPILDARNEEQVYHQLCSLYEDRDLNSRIGKKSREWIMKNHNIQKIIKKYVFVYKSINEGVEIQTIKDQLNLN